MTLCFTVGFVGRSQRTGLKGVSTLPSISSRVKSIVPFGGLSAKRTTWRTSTQHHHMSHSDADTARRCSQMPRRWSSTRIAASGAADFCEASMILLPTLPGLLWEPNFLRQRDIIVTCVARDTAHFTWSMLSINIDIDHATRSFTHPRMPFSSICTISMVLLCLHYSEEMASLSRASCVTKAARSSQSSLTRAGSRVSWISTLRPSAPS